MTTADITGTGRGGATPELCIVAPTFNERENVPVLVARLDAALQGVAWEVIFVDDDSPDGTSALVRELGAKDARVRGIRRVGRRGLAGACIEGMLATAADYVAVMDADLQHDESALPAMLTLLRSGNHDLAIGSRYFAQGSAAGLSPQREASSRFAGWLARSVLKVPVTDPMSGFFMLRRAALDRLAPQLATHGFKILADILSNARGTLRVAEVPYTFRQRLHGDSKLDTQVALDFLGLLVARTTSNLVPVRFVSFVLVGATGMVVHLTVLKVALAAIGLEFGAAQAIATLVAMTSNFFLNNRLTYRDQRLTGVAAAKGLFAFYAICAVGAASNIGVATWLYSQNPVWWHAGLLGSAVGAVWNYALSSALVWRK